MNTEELIHQCYSNWCKSWQLHSTPNRYTATNRNMDIKTGK